MKVQIFNLYDGSTKSFEGPVISVYNQLAAYFPLHAQEARGSLPTLLNMLRRVQYLDVAVTGGGDDFERDAAKTPEQIAEEVNKLYAIDFNPEMEIIIERLSHRNLPVERIKGSSKQLYEELTERYPDYEAMASSSGLKALMDIINTEHPTDHIVYGDDLNAPRFKPREELLNFDGRDLRPVPKDASAYPHPRLVGQNLGFADDSDDID